MYGYKDIREVHFEITQKCQAACPMCDRNQNGGALNPHLKGLAELTYDDCVKMFTPEFVKQLKTFYMCGNHGDPIVAEDTLEIFKYLRSHNKDLWLSMNTNAGAKKPDWWKELAQTFGRMGTVIFSLDGLEDTNHLYRQNVNWKIAITNAQAFIDAGGRARWDYIIFEHNEHQVEEAKAVSERMGCERFQSKKTARFFSSAKSKGKESHQSVNRKGKETQKLSKPKDEKNINSALKKEKELIAKHGSMEHYYDSTPINCKVAGPGNLYISAEGIVLPCCWVGSRMYKWWHKDPKVEQVWQFLDRANNVNAKEVGLEKAINSGLMQDIESSWNINGVNNGKLKVCAEKCGIGFDAFKAQYE